MSKSLKITLVNPANWPLTQYALFSSLDKHTSNHQSEGPGVSLEFPDSDVPAGRRLPRWRSHPLQPPTLSFPRCWGLPAPTCGPGSYLPSSVQMPCKQLPSPIPGAWESDTGRTPAGPGYSECGLGDGTDWMGTFLWSLQTVCPMKSGGIWMGARVGPSCLGVRMALSGEESPWLECGRIQHEQ